MKGRSTVFLILAVLLSKFSFAQDQGAWIRYYDTAKELIGFKDLKGNIRIPAQFGGLTRADSFYNIAAVSDTSYKNYYLLKNGKKVGRDSVFVFDFYFDCESEEKIIFKDWKKDRVGFLGKNGEVIIPAIYNYVGSFRNGMAIAHRNAKRFCWDKKDDTLKCEHLGWKGGETILINEKNEILVDSLNIYSSNIDWYSKRINEPVAQIDTTLYTTIKGVNNTTYTFLDYDKEFRKWYYNKFVTGLRSASIDKYLYNEVTFWTDDDGWISMEKDAFLKKFPALLTAERFAPGKLTGISLDQGEFNELIFDKPVYRKYLNSCGEHNRDRYPIYNVMLTHYKKREKPLNGKHSDFNKQYEIDTQDHFEFLRTEDGWRLLSVSVRK
jgi:hypothetical protein